MRRADPILYRHLRGADMQLDRIKAGIVYGSGLPPMYTQVGVVQFRQAKFVRAAPRHHFRRGTTGLTVEYSIAGTTAAVFVDGFCAIGVALNTADSPNR